MSSVSDETHSTHITATVSDDYGDEKGDTPLHRGFRLNMDIYDLVKLLRKGADVNAKNLIGRTPLHEAAIYSRICGDAIHLLASHGASFSTVDNESSSVLHDLLKNPKVSMEMIHDLLRYGADPDCRDNNNLPPLAYVQSSTLSKEAKLAVTKFLIQSSIAYKLKHHTKSTIESLDHYLLRREELLSLSFLPESNRSKWEEVRDSSIREVIKICYENVNAAVPEFDISVGYSGIIKSKYVADKY